MAVKKCVVGVILSSASGMNFIKLLADKGYLVSALVDSRTLDVHSVFENDKDARVHIADDLSTFLQSIEKNRKIFIQMNSDQETDTWLDLLIAELQTGDLLIDLGDSHYKSTIRRSETLANKDVEFVDLGIFTAKNTGSSEPAMLACGSKSAEESLLPILENIAGEFSGVPAVNWVCGSGAAHFAKSIHDGIVAANMQLIAEIYEICRLGMHFTNEEIARFFDNSIVRMHEGFLIELTKKILRQKDKDTFTLDLQSDDEEVSQYGASAVQYSLDLGVSAPTISAAVQQRFLSKSASVRKVFASTAFKPNNVLVKESMITVLPDALICARLISYVEGFHLLKVASQAYNWDLDLAEISRIWMGGDVINMKSLYIIKQAFEEAKEEQIELLHLFESPMIASLLNTSNMMLASVITSVSVASSVAIPTFSAASNYLRSFASIQLPMNMLLAQNSFLK